MVSPLWDFAFIINAPWILFAAAYLLFLEGWFPDVDNFRIYFLTLPHRFITLALVYLDRDQFSKRPKTFVGLPLGFTVLVLAAGSLGTGVLIGTSTLLCILTIDYIWNAYHFASQHYGVTRIYGRKAGGDRPKRERAILVPAISWTLLSAADLTLVDGPARILFTAIDLLAAAALVSLVVLEIRAGAPSRPKLAYLVSVTLLYGGILVCPYIGLGYARRGLLVSTGFFHAVEYLAIVHFYVKGKMRGDGFRGPFRLAAPVWAQTVVFFALAFGTLALFSAENLPAEIYLPILTVGSFCHYSYDAMIWKLRKPAVSKALGAELSP